MGFLSSAWDDISGGAKDLFGAGGKAQPGAIQGPSGGATYSSPHPVQDPNTGKWVMSQGGYVDASGAPLVKDQVTGNLVNQQNGTVYNSQNGLPVTDPNLAQQSVQNLARSSQLQTQANSLNPQLDATTQSQSNLAGQLNNTITNPNASSVANTQLQQTQGQTDQKILGTASGATGANVADARRNAVNALAGAETANVGNAALTRANEVATAEGQEGNVLNQQSQDVQARQATNLQGAQAASQEASTAQTAQQGLNQKTDENNQNNIGKGVAAGTSFLGSFA